MGENDAGGDVYGSGTAEDGDVAAVGGRGMDVV